MKNGAFGKKIATFRVGLLWVAPVAKPSNSWVGHRFRSKADCFKGSTNDWVELGQSFYNCHGKLEAYPTGLAEHGRLHSGLEDVARRGGIHTVSGLQGCSVGARGKTRYCQRWQYQGGTRIGDRTQAVGRIKCGELGRVVGMN